MNKKGFTLIELLAVILILGIIALIAIPTVNNILKESRLGAFEASSRNIIKAAEEKCLTEHMKGNTVGQFIFTSGKVSPALDVKGDLPKSGIINLNENCEATATLSDGDRKYVLTYEGSSIEECTDNNCAFASDIKPSDEKYQCFNFDNKTGTILKYDGSNPACQGDVYIPAMIDGVPVVKINDVAFSNPVKVICENNGNRVEHEGTYIPKEEDGYCYGGFNYNASYTYNTLDMSDAGFLEEIGNDAFYNTQITNIKFNNNLKKVGKTAFSMINTEKIVLPASLEQIGNSAFYESNIEELVINNKLKFIESYSFSMNPIKEINIPEGVEYIGEGAFAWGNWDAANTVVNISDTVIGVAGWAFMDCGIVEVSFGNKLEYIGEYAFNSNSIKEIEIPNSVKQIDTSAFSYNKLTNLFVYNRNSDGTENKKSINSYGGIESIVTVPDHVEEIGAFAFEYAEITNLTLNEGLKHIREGAFRSNIFSSITIPSTVEVIEKNAFLKDDFGNKSLSLISNKTGRSFDWSSITGSDIANQVFETGTISHDNGEIQVSN